MAHNEADPLAQDTRHTSSRQETLAHTTMTDSAEYQAKKKFFSHMLTIFGRKPVLEALQNRHLEIYRVHLSDSNKSADILDEITAAAQKKNVEILMHSRDALARISKNKKQDQGVAADLKLAGFCSIDDFISNQDSKQDSKHFELIAIDGVTNPQNLGMIIRSLCASPMTGLLLPEKGCAKLDSLVIKASAGTLFRANIIRCSDLEDGITKLKKLNAQIFGLDANSKTTLSSIANDTRSKVFILGNESDGISTRIQRKCDNSLKIPMANGVESLNVAVTASLIAFRNAL